MKKASLLVAMISLIGLLGPFGCSGLSEELFAGTIDTDTLVERLSSLNQYLADYVGAAQSDLNNISRYYKSYHDLYEQEINTAVKLNNVQVLLANPINKYMLVKRASIDWNNNINSLIVADDQSAGVVTPTEIDLTEAALNVLRLQSTYQLNSSTIARGSLLINGKTNESQEMTAGDCWQLGRQAYLIGDDHVALEWIEESLRRYHQNEQEADVALEDILRLQAFATYKIGDKKESFRITQELMKLIRNQPDVKQYLMDVFDQEEQLRAAIISQTAQQNHDRVYKSLCRGEKSMDPAMEAKLKCSVSSMSNPYLILQPVRQEQVSLDPFIAVFYNVINDKEIRILQETAKSKLVENVLLYQDSGMTGHNPRQVSTYANIRLKDHSLIKKVAWQRVEDVTGLEAFNTNFSKVIRYGIGGHFSPHFDYIGIRNARTEKWLTEGDRTATWVYYLNDVEAGGYTVFPKAKVAIKPVKGSAVFWYNTLPNGEGNPDTLHAGCPVLSGEKWILSRTFYEHGQEFRRPCRLDREAKS